MKFQLQRYAEWLRDACTGRAEAWPELTDEPRQVVAGSAGFLEEVAHLLACGLLDARFDSLLIPILLRSPRGDAGAWLEAQDFGLPAGFWRTRLEEGACILLIEAGPRDAEWIERAAAEWPRCRFVVASESEMALRGWTTSRRTSSAPSA